MFGLFGGSLSLSLRLSNGVVIFIFFSLLLVFFAVVIIKLVVLVSKDCIEERLRLRVFDQDLDILFALFRCIQVATVLIERLVLRRLCNDLSNHLGGKLKLLLDRCIAGVLSRCDVAIYSRLIAEILVDFLVGIVVAQASVVGRLFEEFF